MTGMYHAATSSRQTRTQPPIRPAKTKFRRNRAIPPPREPPPGMIQSRKPPDPKRKPAEDPEPEIVQLPVLYAGGAEDAVQQRGRRHRQDGLAEKVF